MRKFFPAKNLFSLSQRAVSLAAVFLFLTVAAAAAIPLREYRDNVRRAFVLLDSLQSPDDDLSPDELIENERATMKEIRRLVPKIQRVEIGDAEIEANNAWLENDLKTIEETTASGESRFEALRRTTERLGAVRDRVEFLLDAQTIDSSKNSDKQKLDEILRRPEFRKPDEAEKSVLERWSEAFQKWLADLFRRNQPNISPSDAPNLSSLGTVLSYVVIAAAFLIVAFVVYRYLLLLIGRENRLKIITDKEPRIVLGERLGANESPADLLAEAETLARAGDARAAIRKGYIALLCELSDRKIVNLARHKTNRDYLGDLKKRPEIFQNVRLVTGSFERHWYGRVPADERDWQTFRGNYDEAVKQK